MADDDDDDERWAYDNFSPFYFDAYYLMLPRDTRESTERFRRHARVALRHTQLRRAHVPLIHRLHRDVLRCRCDRDFEHYGDADQEFALSVHLCLLVGAFAQAPAFDGGAAHGGTWVANMFAHAPAAMTPPTIGELAASAVRAGLVAERECAAALSDCMSRIELQIAWTRGRAGLGAAYFECFDRVLRQAVCSCNLSLVRELMRDVHQYHKMRLEEEDGCTVKDISPLLPVRAALVDADGRLRVPRAYWISLAREIARDDALYDDATVCQIARHIARESFKARSILCTRKFE